MKIILLAMIITILMSSVAFSAGNSPANASSLSFAKTVTNTIDTTSANNYQEKSDYFKFKTTKEDGITYRIYAIVIEKGPVEAGYLEIGLLDSDYGYVSDTIPYTYDMMGVYSVGSMETRDYKLKKNSTYYYQVYCTSDIRIKYQAGVKKIVAKPGIPEIKTVKSGNRKLVVSYGKAKYNNRYQIQIQKKGSSKWKTYNNGTKIKMTIGKLKKSAKYRVRIRAQRKVDGRWYSSKWSKASKYVKIR